MHSASIMGGTMQFMPSIAFATTTTTTYEERSTRADLYAVLLLPMTWTTAPALDASGSADRR